MATDVGWSVLSEVRGASTLGAPVDKNRLESKTAIGPACQATPGPARCSTKELVQLEAARTKQHVPIGAVGGGRCGDRLLLLGLE